MRIIDNNGNYKNIQMRNVQMHLIEHLEGNIIKKKNLKGFVLMPNMFILILDDGNYKNNQKYKNV